MALLEAVSSSFVFGAARWPQKGRDLRVRRKSWARVTRLQVQCRRVSSVSSTDVVVKRESGKNGKLMKALVTSNSILAAGWMDGLVL